MSKSTSNVVAFADPSVPKDPLTELIRQGAQQLLSQAIEIELVVRENFISMPMTRTVDRV